jgi:uncharacterized protein YdhG (YjbR/CyaY superfamily)
MSKREPTSVDEYIAAQPEAARGALRRVRSAVRNALPGAEELIAYKMPAYKLNDAVVIHFAGWKQHYSLYLASERVVAAFNDELAPYDVKKGTVSFPLSKPVPVKLIERIAKFRAKEIAARPKGSLKRSLI